MSSLNTNSNPRYKTPIKELPLKTSTGRTRNRIQSCNSKQQLETTHTHTSNKELPLKHMTDDEIRNKINSLSEKEFQGLYITCLIMLYDTLMESKKK